MANEFADVVIVGSGVAGLMTAHLLADHMNVIILTKSKVETSNSSCAQGGMAAAISPSDHWSKHLHDTVVAGQHHHRTDHLELVVRRAPSLVKTLETLGVRFDRNEAGELLLGMEGAHSHRRIVHASGDQTGKMFVDTLIASVKSRVNNYENTFVRRLIKNGERVVGVETNDRFIYARAVVLATGGCGQLYRYTSNVAEATGDGFALAYRAGASLIDMEFVQFHPTLFVKDDVCYGLISEAVRGEGAILIDCNGERLLKDHPLGDLAPRDVVSRAINKTLQKGRNVYLDCSNVANLNKKFPGLYERMQRAKSRSLALPVAPGAHFISGGVETDANGRTDVESLFAVGEVACTGVHGANRLASNSLLEGLVFAERVASHLLANEEMLVTEHDEDEGPKSVCVLPTKPELKEKMTRLVGIERDERGLLKMKQWLEPFLPSALNIRREDDDATVELKNMVLTAFLITNAASKRTESRGGHFRADFPYLSDRWQGVVIVQKNGAITLEKKYGNDGGGNKDESVHRRRTAASFFN